MVTCPTVTKKLFKCLYCVYKGLLSLPCDNAQQKQVLLRLILYCHFQLVNKQNLTKLNSGLGSLFRRKRRTTHDLPHTSLSLDNKTRSVTGWEVLASGLWSYQVIVKGIAAICRLLHPRLQTHSNLLFRRWLHHCWPSNDYGFHGPSQYTKQC